MTDIGYFWVVTRPTKHSTLDDILFRSDAKGLMIQALGGLKPDNVLCVTKSWYTARRRAQKQLDLKWLDEQIKLDK